MASAKDLNTYEPIPGVREPREYLKFINRVDPRVFLSQGSLFFVAVGDKRNYVYAFLVDEAECIPVGFHGKVLSITDLLDNEWTLGEEVSLILPELEYPLIPKKTEENFHVDMDLDFLQWIMFRGWETSAASSIRSLYSDIRGPWEIFKAILINEILTNKSISKDLKEKDIENAKSSHWRKAAAETLEKLKKQKRKRTKYPVYWYDEGLLVEYDMPKLGEEYPDPDLPDKKEQVGDVYNVLTSLFADYESLYYSLKPEAREFRERTPNRGPYYGVNAAVLAAAAATAGTADYKSPSRLGKSRPSTRPSK